MVHSSNQPEVSGDRKEASVEAGRAAGETQTNFNMLDELGLSGSNLKSPTSTQAKEQPIQTTKEVQVNPTPLVVNGSPESKLGATSTSARPVLPNTEIDRQPTKAAAPSDALVTRTPASDSLVKPSPVVLPSEATSKSLGNPTPPADTNKTNLFVSPTGFDAQAQAKAQGVIPKVEVQPQTIQSRDAVQGLIKPVDAKPVDRTLTGPAADQAIRAKTPGVVDAPVASISSTSKAPVNRESVPVDTRSKPDVAQISNIPVTSRADLPNLKGGNAVDALPRDIVAPKTNSIPLTEARFDSKPADVRPADARPVSLNTSDVASPRDTKAAGVANEVFGAKPSDRTDPNGAKSDLVNSISNKVDQAVPGKSLTGDAHPEGAKADGVRNDTTRTDGVKADGSRSDGGALGGKQPTTTDASNPIGKQNATEAGGAAGKQPTVGDAASTGGRQTSTEAGGRSPGSGGGGGGASDGASTTHKNDTIAASSNKAEGNAGTGSSGSSGPTDRAPHKPFGVEDAQGTKANSVDGKAIATGTASGPRFDTGETKISTPGSGSSGAPGSVAGGAGTGRFDVPDLKPGSGTAAGAGAGGGSSSFDSTQIPGQKGFDVTGGKTTPEGILNQPGKAPTGRIGEGIKIGDDNPIVMPGMIAGREGSRRQSDQVFGDRANPPAAGVKASGEDTVIKGPKDNTGKASDAIGIPSISGPADMGGALRNFAQSVLSTDKGDQTAGKAPGAGKDSVKSQTSEEGPKTFAGPGQKTTVLGETPASGKDSQVVKASADNTESTDASRRIAASGGVSGDVVKGVGSSGILGSKKDEFGFGEEGDVDPAGELIPIEEFALPAVDFLSESDEAAEVEESVDEAGEGEEFDERTYELALGLQLYNAVAEAQYGAYHYFTREGDTVELVSRDVVGDPRTAPLVFSLNKDHILASTEYGVHPFKVGVMIQLPTPREIKMYFGPQSK